MKNAFLMHSAGFHRIRHCGLFANSHLAQKWRQLLNVPEPLCCRRSRPLRAASTPAPLPLLRRSHDRHRDLRARLLASKSSGGRNQDRHLMTAILTTLQCCSRVRSPASGHGSARPTTVFDRLRTLYRASHGAPRCRSTRSIERCGNRLSAPRKVADMVVGLY